jgi:hypothetical protein
MAGNPRRVAQAVLLRGPVVTTAAARARAADKIVADAFVAELPMERLSLGADWFSSPVVYVLAGDRGVLYVGSSRHGLSRISGHRSKPWWPEVKMVGTFSFATEYEARVKEREYIIAMKPPHNLHVPTEFEVNSLRMWRGRPSS